MDISNSARSFIRAKNTVTSRISTSIVESTMHSTIGAAIGLTTSKPIPDSQRTGMLTI
jgi:hypothetical protein